MSPSHIAWTEFKLWSQLEVDLLASSHAYKHQHYYTLEAPLPQETLVLNNFKHYWQFQDSYDFLPPALALLAVLKILVEYITVQYRLLTILVSHWIEVFWFPIIHYMLEVIPCHCDMIKDLVRDVLADWVLKGQPSLHLILWLLKSMVCADKVLFHSMSGGDRGMLPIHNKWVDWCAEEGIIPNNTISVP